MSHKPLLTYGKIWDLNFGYLGLQVCLSLIIANTSRILSALGADTNDLAFLWLLAPVSGLILQPIVGHFSDITWTRYGRRIPYILAGVLITAVMMVFMPNSYVISRVIPPVFAGVSILFIIQSSLNMAIQPYRSLVGDMVDEKQSNLGYSVQTLLSNVGGLIGSFLPFILVFWGVSNQAEGDSRIVSSVRWSFYIGAIILLVTNLWTCLRVKEYPPAKFREYNNIQANDKAENAIENKKSKKTYAVILQLTLVQFFSWFAFYYIWVYMTDGIAHTVWKTGDPFSASYNDAANWFGVLSGVYSLVAALFSVLIPRFVKKTGRKNLYSLALVLGGLSLWSIYYIESQYMLLIPMIGIGIAWAMILTIPFAILSSVVPSGKMGLFMGLFNITIVAPQIVGGLAGNYIFTHWAGQSAIFMMIIAGISLLIAALTVLFISDKK